MCCVLVASPSLRTWGESMIHTLTVGEDGWVMRESMRSWTARSARLVERIEAAGADTDASWLPTCGLVHLDLHTGNLLAGNGGMLSGIIDWEGACAGDHRFDLATFAFDLDGVGQHIWDRVDHLIEPRLLRAYVAHMALRGTDWAIRHHPGDVPRQLARAERVLNRYSA